MANAQPKAAADPHRVRDFADRTIKGVLSHRVLLEQLLKNALDPQVFQRLDCSKAQPQKTDFIDPRWRKRFADVFWLIPWRDQPDSSPALIGVLIEHQSEPDWLMPLRILIYIVRFWERQLKQWEDRKEPKTALRLSVTIPIIFSTSTRAWKGPRTLRQLLQVPDLLEKHVPEWESIYWELGQHEIEELKKSGDELMQALAAIRAGRMKFDVFRDLVYNAAEHLLKSTSLGKAERHELLEMILGWSRHRRTQKEWETITTGLEEMFDASPETVKMLKTYKRSVAAHYEKVGFAKGEQTGFAKGEQTGFAKGQQTGFETGQLQAARRLLTRLLERKFGPIDAEIQHRIDNCDNAAKVERAAEEVAAMNSLADFHLNEDSQ